MIVAEYSNSINVTKRTIAAQDTRTPLQRRRDGFAAYCDGLSIYDIYDPQEQVGWWLANSAEAETETAGYAESMGW